MDPTSAMNPFTISAWLLLTCPSFNCTLLLFARPIDTRQSLNGHSRTAPSTLNWRRRGAETKEEEAETTDRLVVAGWREVEGGCTALLEGREAVIVGTAAGGRRDIRRQDAHWGN